MRAVIITIITILTFYALYLHAGSPAWAGSGGSIEPAQIESKRPLSAGQEVILPVIKVTNTGEEETTFFMSVVAVQGQADLGKETGCSAPPAWFRFVPERFKLGRGETQAVKVILKIPSAAYPGEYCAGIQAAAEPVQGSNIFNIALVSILQFSVEKKNPGLLVLFLVIFLLAGGLLFFKRGDW